MQCTFRLASSQGSEKRSRQEAYTPAHRQLLAQLINTYDPDRITWRADRSAAHSAKKRRIWDEIVLRFNQGSGRRESSNASQLIKQGQFMKSKVRCVI